MPDASPTTLIQDMEVAAANSFLTVFGEHIRIHYCFFHWRKALHDNLSAKKCYLVSMPCTYYYHIPLFY